MRTLAIVGVGLIGGSIALAARARGAADRIVGVDEDLDALDIARRRCSLDDCFEDVAGAARQAQLTIFCTPVDCIVEQTLTAAASCPPGALFTDVGSTKTTIVRALDERLPGHCRFIGSHPLAGSEKRGAGYAHERLLEGRVVVLTPTAKTSPQTLDEMRSFWQTLGTRVVVMSPEEHDRALALTSHLPHLVASTLAGVLPAELRNLTATGFRDTSRVAAGDPAMWAAIFLQNRDSILHALATLGGALDQFRAALEAGDRSAITALLTQGKRNRDALGS
jgi:prephenate dehydrogenase